MKNSKWCNGAAMAAVFTCGMSAEVLAQENFYAGKRIELIVPYAPGGGNDAFGRLLQNQYRACIPEAASVQVVNVAGGGTVIGANEFELLRAHDGLSILVTASTTAYAWMLGQEGVRYSPRNWTPILGLPGGGVIYIRSGSGITNMQQLASTDSRLVFGGMSATGLDILPLLSFEILGVEIQPVLGYEGKGPLQIAFQQGEVDIDFQTTPAYIAQVASQVAEGTAIPLYTVGMVEGGRIVRDPAFPDIPSFLDAYQEARGSEPEGLAWEAYLALVSSGVSAQRQVWIHSESPPEAIEALREATNCVIGRDEFYQLGKDILAGYTPIVGDILDSSVDELISVSDEVLTWLREYLNEKFEAELAR